MYRSANPPLVEAAYSLFPWPRQAFLRDSCITSTDRALHTYTGTHTNAFSSTFFGMDDTKHEPQAVAQTCDSESQQNDVFTEKRGTAGDQKDMYRMGKQQELRRNFRFVSIFGYSMVLMATWETVLTSEA